MDGYHQATNTVFEFLGCNFHACPHCHPLRRNKTRYCHPDRTQAEVYEATMKKIQQLKASGYKVVVQWECDYLKEKQSNPNLKAFVEMFELVEPLEPRDAFFGGRTEAIALYANVH